MTVQDRAGSLLRMHRELLDRADALPRLPSAVLALATATSDPSATVDDIAAIVSRDPVITANVLREANSAAHSSIGPIEQTDRAVMRLGTARVLAIALDGSVDTLRLPLRAYGLTATAVHQNALAAAAAAEACRKMSPRPVGREVDAAALLHDLGKAVLDPLMDIELAPALLELDPTGLTMERELVGVDHCEVAALVLGAWRLPTTIVDAVTGHHEPGDHLGAAVVAVADWVAHVVAGEIVEGAWTTVADQAWETIGLADRVDDVVAATRTRLALTGTATASDS